MKGGEDLTNTEIIYNALLSAEIELPELEIEEIKSSCMVCGKAIKKGVKRNKVVSANFTDYDTFQNIEGTHICKECATCIKTRELRINNILADKNNLYIFKKKDLEKYLLNIEKYIEGDFVIGITRNFKKHNSFRCPINSNTKQFFIREEDKVYSFKMDEAKKLYKMMWQMYLHFTKDEILTGQYNTNKIYEFGLDEFQYHEKLFRQHRGRHQFALLVYMLDSEKRNEIVSERIKQVKQKNQEG